MALIKCPECEKEMSEQMTTCPHCGYCPATTASNTNWKSYLVIAFGIVLLLVAIFLVTDEMFTYYISKVGYYYEEYQGNTAISNSYSSSYFSSGYSQVASMWKDMLIDAVKYVAIRGLGAIVAVVASIICIKKGVKNIKRDRR